MTDIKPPAAPRELGAAGRALWRDIVTQMAEDGLLPDRRERRYLLLACSEQDQLEGLQAELVGLRSIVKGSQGQDVANPLIAECRRSRTFIATMLARVELFDSTGSGKGTGAGSRTSSTQARAAAFARHGSGR